MFDDVIIEECAEAVHKAYCKEYFKRGSGSYWTGGDYSKLDEPTKEIDRATVRAVIKVLDKNGCEYAAMCNDFRRLKREVEALRSNRKEAMAICFIV